MKSRCSLPAGAALLAGFAIIAGVAPAQAACDCPSGSQWLTVGQSTKVDKCGLQLLLLRIDQSPISADRYVLYVKSDLFPHPKAASAPVEHFIRQNGTASFPAGTCGSLLIGAHRAPQISYIELNWSYFE